MSIASAPVRQPVRARLTVPWPGVALLAAAMAYADGYWMITVRGAVGAVQRAQGPFSVWWRESTLTLPLFALAVLAALTLSMRLFGPHVPRRRAVAGTLLLLVAAGTLAGIAEIAASSAYDYHLQTAELRFMDSMHNVCVRSCLTQELHATLAVHIHAVLFAARALLITNLVLVPWVFALRGRQIEISAPGTGKPARTGGRRLASTRVEDVRLVVIAALIGAAAIHAAVTPEHLHEWAAAGVFFLLLAAAQLAIAGGLLLTRNPTSPQHRTWLLAAAALSAGSLVLWLYSRTVGLPIGPGAGNPEPVGPADVMAGLLELVTLIATIALLGIPARLQRRARASDHLRGIAVLAVAAATILGLAFTATGSSWLGDFGIAGQPMHHISAH